MSSRPPKQGRRGLRLVIALALAGAAAAGVYLYASSLQQQVSATQVAQQASAPTALPRVSVVVAKTAVPSNTPLTSDMFEVKVLPAEAVVTNSVTSLDQLSGKVLSDSMRAGDQLVTTRLVDGKGPSVKTFADEIPVGMRAMSLSFTEQGGAAGLIAPGNHVDIIALFKKGSQETDQSMVILQDVLVLAVAQSTAPEQLPLQPAATPQAAAPAIVVPGTHSQASPSPTANPRVPVAPPGTRTVTLAVTPEGAARLALAETDGTLRYIIRPTGDDSRQAVLPANVAGLPSPLRAWLPEDVAVVSVDAVNARSEPAINSAPVGQLPYGTQLQVIGQSADWFKVKLPDGREAWVAGGWIVTGR
jgi:Flp pilus assembly protein CpaB